MCQMGFLVNSVAVWNSPSRAIRKDQRGNKHCLVPSGPRRKRGVGRGGRRGKKRRRKKEEEEEEEKGGLSLQFQKLESNI